MKPSFLLTIFIILFWGKYLLAESPGGSPSIDLSGRVRSLSMTRDYEGKGTGSNSTLGLLVHAQVALSDELDAGATYIYAKEVLASGQSEMLSNNGFNLLNEAWLRLQSGPGIEARAGRFISNGEIFRKDDSRQKPRAIEGGMLSVSGVNIGHALQMSHYLQSGDRWKFNPFDEVFKVGEDSEGVSWVDALLKPSDRMEIALFDAYAWEVTNLAGTRMQWRFSDNVSLLVYARIESGVGENGAHNSEAYGLSLQTRLGQVKLEPGIFSVHGDSMLFQETTTGFNHALSSCMIIYSSPFDGGADTFYLKGTSQVGQTGLYLLGLYTTHAQLPFTAWETNCILKQPISDHVELALKAGLGYRENDSAANTTATDVRFFVTYVF